MCTSPAASERLKTRANPWYPFSRAQCDAAGNSAMRCPTRAAERADTFAPERSGTLLRVTSRVKGCGGGERSGVEAYIVLGICACARDRSMRARCSARARCERCACAVRRSQSRAAAPIAPCASGAGGAAAKATATSIALTRTVNGRLAGGMLDPRLWGDYMEQRRTAEVRKTIQVPFMAHADS